MAELHESTIVGERPAKLSELTEELSQLAELTQNAKRTFFGLALACAYSFLTLFTTTDDQLLTNSASSELPVINAEVPIVAFFVLVPVALTFGYLYFHMYLQTLWRCASRLPSRTV